MEPLFDRNANLEHDAFSWKHISTRRRGLTPNSAAVALQRTSRRGQQRSLWMRLHFRGTILAIRRSHCVGERISQ